MLQRWRKVSIAIQFDLSYILFVDSKLKLHSNNFLTIQLLPILMSYYSGVELVAKQQITISLLEFVIMKGMNFLRKSSTGAVHQTTWPLSNFQLSMINTRPSLIHFQVNFSLVFQTTFTEKSRKMLTQKILKQIDQSHQLKEIHLLQRKKKTQKVWLWSLIWKKLTDYTITLEQLKMIVILFHRAQWD